MTWRRLAAAVAVGFFWACTPAGTPRPGVAAGPVGESHMITEGMRWTLR